MAKNFEKTRVKRRHRKSGDVYKRLTVIFGIATFVFGISSVALTMHSIQLQQKESASRHVLYRLRDILTALSDTSSNLQTRKIAEDMKGYIPSDYRHYVRSVGALAESLEVYERKLITYETRIAKTLLPNQMLREKFPHKGWMTGRALIFEIIDPVGDIRPRRGSSTCLLVKSKIPSEEIYCFQVLLASEKYTLGIYNYLPQGTYNKLELPEADLRHAVTATVGVFLKEDTLEEYPTFYRKEVKVATVENTD